jgi:hypothetical protein
MSRDEQRSEFVLDTKQLLNLRLTVMIHSNTIIIKNNNKKENTII